MDAPNQSVATDRAAGAICGTDRSLEQAATIARLGYWEWDAANGVTSWSRGTYDLFRLDTASDRDAVQACWKAITDRAADSHGRSFQNQLTSGSDIDCDCAIVRPGGVSTEFHVSGRAHRDDSGRLLGVFGTVQDISEKRSKTQSLVFSESVLNALHEAVFSTNEDFEVLYWNPVCEELFGITAGEATGKHIGKSLKMLEDYAGQNKGRGETLLRQGFNDEQQRWLTPKGIRHVDVRLRPMMKNGTRCGWVTLARDITDQKLKARQLEESENRYRGLVNACPGGIVMTSKDGAISYASPGTAALVGSGVVEEAVKRSPLDFISPRDRDRARADMAMALTGMPRGSAEYKTADGCPVSWLEVSSSAIQDAQGQTIGLVSTLTDASDKHNTTELIRARAEEWSATFDAIPDMIYLIDKQHRLLRVNRQFAITFGREPDDFIGKKCYEIVHKTNAPISGCPCLTTIAKGEPCSVEIFEPKLEAFIEASTAPLRDANGTIRGCVHLARDITQRRKMQEQLLLSDRLASIGELVSGVAHELNNPLASVIGFSQLISEKTADGELRDDIEVIRTQAERCRVIVRNLLTFARKHAPDRQKSNVNTLLRDVLRLRAYEHAANNIDIVENLQPDLPEISLDYFQMQQVFLNIILNAEYFMRQSHGKGCLTVTTEADESHVNVSITDDGPGISGHDLGQVFNPFFTTKEVGKGTGLGLSICRGIVVEHGGEIVAKSPPGKGATFLIRFPIGNSATIGDDQLGPESAEEEGKVQQ